MCGLLDPSFCCRTLRNGSGGNILQEAVWFYVGRCLAMQASSRRNLAKADVCMTSEGLDELSLSSIVLPQGKM